MHDTPYLTEVLVSGRSPHGDPIPLLTPLDGHARRAAAAAPDPGQANALEMLADVARGGDGAPLPDPGPQPAPPSGRTRGPLIRVGLAVAAGLGLCAGLAAFTPALRHWPSGQFHWLGRAWPGLPPYALAAGAVAIISAITAVALAAQAVRRALDGHKAEDVLTIVVALIGSIAAMQGMWRFFGVLQMPIPLRVLLFGFLDGATVVEALRARRNMREAAVTDAASTGIDGVAMWVLTSLSGVLASLDAGSVDAAVFRLAAPLVAAWLWDRGLRLERRRRTGQQIHWRVTPERVLVWLRLAEPTGRTVPEVDAQRRIHRLARTVVRYQHLQAARAGAWRMSLAMRNVYRALAQADQHAGLADSGERQAQLMCHLSVLQGARSLVLARPAAPWAPARDEEPTLSDTGLGPAALPPARSAHAALEDGDSGSAARPARRLRRPRKRPAAPDAAQPDDGTPYTELADDIGGARASRDYARVHELLTGREDYAEFTKWLGASGRPKRLMALTALYALGDVTARTEAARWIQSLVPGPAGKVDKKELRDAAAQVKPHWPGESPGPEPTASSDGTTEN